MAVYSSIEFYPPSLNALTSIITHFGKISILSRNVKSLQWDYKTNVENIQSGDFTNIRDAEKKPMYWKIYSFILFTWNMWKTLQKEKPALVILYDPIPIISYYLIYNFISQKPLLWYHNHDVLELSKTKKYTIAWAAALAEKLIFEQLDFFSLPAQDRKQYFPLEKLKGKYFYIPNVPAKSFYNQFYKSKTVKGKTIKLIFQGTIAKGHGLEEIIKHILPIIIADRNFELNLKGLISDNYKNELLQLSVANKVENQVIFHGFGAYQDVPRIASECQVGIAIHKGTDVMNKTLGTSSNKIYEYAAVGLPILLFDNQHFRGHLGKYQWAFFTDVSEKSLLDCIEKIIANYEYLSQKAHEDFESHLNFETYFNPVLDEIMQEIT